MLTRLLLIVFTSLFISACSDGETNVSSGNRDGVMHLGNGAEPEGLDPHTVTGIPETRLLRALFEGLVVKNPHTLEPEPGVAQSWEISDDGKIYTFHLNPQAKWSNGDMVTADDYLWSWQRALHPQMGNRNAYLLYPVLNAQAYAEGDISDFSQVGVKALDQHTLVVSLHSPTAYFLQLLDHFSTFAVHRSTLLKFGSMSERFTGWTRPDNIVSNGAFTLQEWKLNRHIRMAKSDTYWDRDKVKLKALMFYPTDNLVTEERMFRTGQLHYTSDIPLDKIPGYRELANSPYQQSPYLGTYFYEFNTTRVPLNDVRVRRALAMSIDRDSLNRNVLQGTGVPAYAITPPDTLGYQPPVSFEYDPQQARELLAAAGYPDGAGWPGIELIFNTQESHRKIAVALQQMWKQELNIDVTASNQEWKVFLSSLSQGQFDIARRSWIGDYVDANNFLELYLSNSGNNYSGFSSTKYDRLILRQAPAAPDRQQRYQLFNQAETLLMEQMPILPLYTYTSKHLIQPSVKGMPRNIMNAINFKYVWLQETGKQNQSEPQ